MRPSTGHELDAKIKVRELSAWYKDERALDDVSVDIPRNQVTAIIGASGCGKTTLLRCLNQIINTYKGGRMEGDIFIDDVLVTERKHSIHKLRRRFGVLAQKPNPFPKTIQDNVAYGARLHGLAQDAQHLESIVRRQLIRVGLWEEVKEQLSEPATSLSVGQQQRLCIARALVYEPEIFLFDEPCAALDPVNGEKVENLIMSLRRDYTVVMVSHHLDLVDRVADYAVFLESGSLVESGRKNTLLREPADERTQQFISALPARHD